MVMFILLGLMDALVAALMLSMHLEIIAGWRLAIIGALYLIGKGIVLRGSFLSILDILAGVYLILMLAGLRTFLAYIFAAVLVYKLIASLVMRGLV